MASECNEDIRSASQAADVEDLPGNEREDKKSGNSKVDGVSLADSGELGETSGGSQCNNVDDKEGTGVHRRRNPASRLFGSFRGSFRKLIRRTSERTSLRSPKGKRYNVTKKANERGAIFDDDGTLNRPKPRRRLSLESDPMFDDTRSDISSEFGSDLPNQYIPAKPPISNRDHKPTYKKTYKNPYLVEMEAIDVHNLSLTESNSSSPVLSKERVVRKVGPGIERRLHNDSSENITTLNPAGSPVPKAKPYNVNAENIARVSPVPKTMSNVRTVHDNQLPYDNRQGLQTSQVPVIYPKLVKPSKTKHKQVAFVADEGHVGFHYCSSLSEAESNSSSGSVPNDSMSSSGSDTSSGLISLPSSLHSLSREQLDDVISDSSVNATPERTRNVRFENRNQRKRLQNTTEAFRRVLPAYSINKDSIYRVGFAARTWDVMRQGFRVALDGDSGFVCDHFLGKEGALGVARELQWMKETHLFNRHMVRDAKKPSFKYACVFLLEQDSCHRHLDTLVLMLYKLAQYYSSDWTKVSVEISYFPRGHNVQKLPKQGDDKRLLKCVYFPQIYPPTSDAADTGDDVIGHGGLLTVHTPSAPLRVDPVFDRLVAFWGDSYEYTVSSSRDETYSITVWLQR